MSQLFVTYPEEASLYVPDRCPQWDSPVDRVDVEVGWCIPITNHFIPHNIVRRLTMDMPMDYIVLYDQI